jgi:hypothetical protein
MVDLLRQIAVWPGLLARSVARSRPFARQIMARGEKALRSRPDRPPSCTEASCDQPWPLERRTTLASIMKVGGDPGTQQSPTMGGSFGRSGVQCRKVGLKDYEFAASFHLTKEQAPESLYA